MVRANELGPVQLLVVGFDKPEFHGRIREELARLRTNDTIRVIDTVLVLKDKNGDVSVLPQSDLSSEGAQAAGAYVSSLIGLGVEDNADGANGAVTGGNGLNDVQVWCITDAIPAGTAAGIALLEHRWAIPLRAAIIESGGQLAADAWIHPSDLEAVGLVAPEPVAV